MFLVVVCFVLFLAMGIPIAMVLGIDSLVFILLAKAPFVLVPQRIFVFLDSFVLMAIPCYMLVGNLMTYGGLTKRLVDFIQTVVGHVRGALAIVNVFDSMIFAGIQGSATADAAGLGAVVIPAMIKAGYTPEIAAALTATTSTMGPIIPPSIVMVVYAVTTNTSIGELFMGGVIPGVIAGIFQLVVVLYHAKKYNWPKNPRRATLKEMLISAKDAGLALVAPILILGGILWGIVTPTESAVMAVIYSLFCAVFVFKEVKIKDLPKIFLETAVLSGGVTIIVGMAGIFSWVLTYVQIPQLATAAIMGISSNPLIFLLLVNIILLFVGTFLEQVSGITIFAPILVPIAIKLGIDPIHFGIVMVFNLVIGLVTPPVGSCLYIVCGIAKVKFEKMVVVSLPYVGALIVTLFLITYWSGLVTFLPRLIFSK
jgi:C4-dicarboxylate transporter, DctM subunit